MKRNITYILVLSIITLVVISCKQKKATNVEQLKERYMVTFNNTEDFISALTEVSDIYFTNLEEFLKKNEGHPEALEQIFYEAGNDNVQLPLMILQQLMQNNSSLTKDDPAGEKIINDFIQTNFAQKQDSLLKKYKMSPEEPDYSDMQDSDFEIKEGEIAE
ncbi:MAG: hypothetical protein LBV69_09325 [Bacteroidales bacterium]|jgi:hypothetical protein|nr:hypothetical protein [Bacteroidales bacterium]